MPACYVNIVQNRKLIHSRQILFPVVVGRSDPTRQDPPPFQITAGENPRFIIADKSQINISRSILRLVPIDDERFTIENLSQWDVLRVGDRALIGIGRKIEFSDNVTLKITQDLELKIQPAARRDSDPQFRRLPMSATRTRETLGQLRQGQPTGVNDLHATTVGSPPVLKKIGQFEATDIDEITKMLRLALEVVQSAAGSSEFFLAAVAAAAEIVNLDRTMVLLRGNPIDVKPTYPTLSEVPEGWSVVAEHSRRTGRLDNASSTPVRHRVSSSLLHRVLESSSTVIHDPGRTTAHAGSRIAPSLQAVECAVAAPILSPAEEVIGVLYGHRLATIGKQGLAVIEDHEATLVEILAGSIAGGMARRAEERWRVTLSGFFSPRVAQLLETNPDLMKGQDAEVSILFCDIRHFSSVTEILGPQKTFEWINDVMNELTQCVSEHDGVLVDYIGDELMAMWGAPSEQANHAALAVATACQMLSAIETLRQRWNDVLPEKFSAGIGVNTGLARVGNLGSHQRFKYGPLGNTVNLASRLQSATKQFGVDCLLSATSVSAAGCLSICRRLAKLTVVGINEPLDVFQMVLSPDDAWNVASREYQQALAEYENGNFASSMRILDNLIRQFPDDRPCRLLLSKAMSELNAPTHDFNGVWSLDHK